MTYDERRQARIERFKERADRARAEAEAAGSRAHELGSAIPMGQPILVGHHSEGRDRRFRARISGLYDKAADLTDKAAHYDQRAHAAEKNRAISSDDPEAVTRIKAKLEGLEAAQERDKGVNVMVRRKDRVGLAAVFGFTSATIDKLMIAGDFAGRLGIPDYVLRNRGAEIRRCRVRIAELTACGRGKLKADERPEAAPVKLETAGGLVLVEEDSADNRIRLIFPGKPEEAVRAFLKLRGFRWSPTAGAWQRQLNNAGRAAAADVVARLERALEAEGQQEAGEESRAQVDDGPGGSGQ